MLLYQLAAIADTVLVRNVPLARSGFEQLVFVVSGLTSILAFILICMSVVGLIVLRAKADELKEKLEDLVDELKPMARNAAAMYEDVREVAKNINAMVDESRDTMDLVNKRVRSSVVTLTDRVDEMSEIIGRVNHSAERVATVATTAVAGVKFGARVMGFGKGRKAKLKAKARAEAAEKPRLRRRD
jgi:methyl-accepting chemotaxis protein